MSRAADNFENAMDQVARSDNSARDDSHAIVFAHYLPPRRNCDSEIIFSMCISIAFHVLLIRLPLMHADDNRTDAIG